MKIRHKIIALTSSITLILIAMTIISNYVGQDQTLQSITKSQTAAYNDIFWEQVNADATSLEKVLTALSQNTALIDTFLSNDRDQLLAAAKPTFTTLKQQFDITHFYFISKDGHVFLRVHNPPKHSDALKRATYLQARDTKKVGKGIEMGKKYFSLRVVMPVYKNGEHVGYFELGEELDHIIGSFKHVTNADISMWASKGYAERKKLTKVFDNVNDWYRIMASDKEQQNTLMNTAASKLARNISSTFSQEFTGSELSVQTFPFKDAFGDEAGIIMIANDVTAQSTSFQSFMMIVVVLAIIFIAIAFALTFFLGRSITNPLQNANRMLSDIAEGEGDLTKRLEIESNDEVGELAENFNHFVDKLQATIGKVSSAATQVSSSSENLSLSTQSANETVLQQQTETEQVAAAINQMSATVQEVSRNANDAANAADEADKQSMLGKNIVSQTIEAINELAKDVEHSADVIINLKSESEKIGTVLDVIKGIAEQTNLLALNAAIEAARAGEQGRGFAVVADEVRTLAQRTQQSTQEIEQMIDGLQKGTNQAEEVMTQSRDRAHKTVDQAASASGSLESITSAVAQIKDMNTQIASAAEEQSSVAEEINKSVNNIQQITQQTVSGSEETMHSCSELQNWGQELQTVVNQFKV